jgi:hypothetical protein
MVLSSDRLNVCQALVIFGAIFCLAPLISLRSDEDYALVDSFLDRVTSDIDRSSPFFLISISIILIPFADLVLDFITVYYGQDSCLRKRVKSSGVIRLTDVERLLFVTGIAIQSTVYFLPDATDDHAVNLINHCVGNANALLLLAPIVIFLGRCTESFTSNKTSALIICSVAGLIVRTVSYFYRDDAVKYSHINVAGTSLILAGAALYGYCILLCCYKFYQLRLGTPSDRRLWLHSMFQSNQQKSFEEPDYSAEDDNEVYANYVPALHIISSITICLSTSIKGLSASSTLNLVWVDPDYIIVCAEIMVLVIELRIRKNEITRGLVSFKPLFFLAFDFNSFLFSSFTCPVNTSLDIPSLSFLRWLCCNPRKRTYVTSRTNSVHPSTPLFSD